VAAVYPKTAAEQAGMEAGMFVTTINGYATETLARAVSLLRQASPSLVVQTDRGTVAIVTPALPTRSLPVHATQIYSSINAALLCLLLWAYYPMRRRDGEVFAAFLLLYPITRILLEVVRVDEGGKFGTGLTISQLVSLVLIAASIVLWAYVLRQPPGSALPSKESLA
jgi:phosphatidylglycerol:prolipoprotein diacylglycerol transferase